MNTAFFTKGLIFGFCIAAPVGPIGILCIRRSLVHGWAAGLLTGLGAATADAVYGAIAGFGIAAVTGFLMGQRDWIQLAGGLFLCWLGIRTLATAKRAAAPQPPPKTVAMGYLAALLLTLTNPMTILSFAAVFAGMGLGTAGAGNRAAGWLVAGVFTGSMTWWVILASISSRFNTRLTPPSMTWINRISGALLTGFGMAVLIGLP